MADEFYDKGVDVGRIKDVGAAQELAGLEATKGVNVALAREKELGRIFKGGLSDEEENFVSVIGGLKTKYPDAFDSVIDTNGQEYLKVRSTHVFGQDVRMQTGSYFTQFGLLEVVYSTIGNGIGIDEVVDLAGYLSGLRDRSKVPEIIAMGRLETRKMLDLGNGPQLELIKKRLTLIQEGESKAREAIQRRQMNTRADGILAKL